MGLRPRLSFSMLQMKREGFLGLLILVLSSLVSAAPTDTVLFSDAEKLLIRIGGDFIIQNISSIEWGIILFGLGILLLIVVVILCLGFSFLKKILNILKSEVV